jgi:hypothetical protein
MKQAMNTAALPPSGLTPQTDRRLTADRHHLFEAGIPNSLTMQGDGALLVCELADTDGLRHTLSWRIPAGYPAEPPALEVEESGLDSYGEIRSGALLVLLPQLGQWHDDLRLVDLTLEVRRRLATGQYRRLGQSAGAAAWPDQERTAPGEAERITGSPASGPGLPAQIPALFPADPLAESGLPNSQGADTAVLIVIALLLLGLLIGIFVLIFA